MTIVKIKENISWLVAEKAVRILFGLTVGIWVARYLGPENYGIYNFSLAFAALFSVCVRLGINQLLVRELIKHKRLEKYYLGTSFILKLSGAIVAILAIAITTEISGIDTLTQWVILIVSFGFIFQPFATIELYFEAQIRSKYAVIAKSAALFISGSLKIFFILKSYSVVYFATTQVIEILLTGVFLMIMYKRTGHLISQWKFSRKIALRILRYSWPLALTIFIMTIKMKTDQIMIGAMLDNVQVGIYSVSVTLASYWYFFPAMIISTIFPYLVSLRKTDAALYQSRLLSLYSLMFWLGLVVGLIIYYFGQQAIIFLYGSDYQDAYWALVINVWNGIWVSQAIACHMWLISENLQIYKLYNNMIIVVLNLLLNFILIPRMGISGAALATLLTQIIGTWGIPLLWRPLRANTWDMIKAVNPKYLLQLRTYPHE